MLGTVGELKRFLEDKDDNLIIYTSIWTTDGEVRQRVRLSKEDNVISSNGKFLRISWTDMCLADRIADDEFEKNIEKKIEEKPADIKEEDSTLYNIEECLTNADQCYLILKCFDGDYIHSEVQRSSCFVNSDNDNAWQTDFGVEIETTKLVEQYFRRNYTKIWAFEDETECIEYWENTLKLGNW